jgi:hypothetical protein
MHAAHSIVYSQVVEGLHGAPLHWHRALDARVVDASAKAHDTLLIGKASCLPNGRMPMAGSGMSAVIEEISPHFGSMPKLRMPSASCTVASAEISAMATSCCHAVMAGAIRPQTQLSFACTNTSLLVILTCLPRQSCCSMLQVMCCPVSGCSSPCNRDIYIRECGS